MNYRCYIVSPRTGKRRDDMPYYKAVDVDNEDQAKEYCMKYMGFRGAEINPEWIYTEPLNDGE